MLEATLGKRINAGVTVAPEVDVLPNGQNSLGTHIVELCVDLAGQARAGQITGSELNTQFVIGLSDRLARDPKALSHLLEINKPVTLKKSDGTNPA